VGEKGYELQETSLKIIVIKIKRRGHNRKIFVGIFCNFILEEVLFICFHYGRNIALELRQDAA
jgi:hypothetical protein